MTSPDTTAPTSLDSDKANAAPSSISPENLTRLADVLTAPTSEEVVAWQDLPEVKLARRGMMFLALELPELVHTDSMGLIEKAFAAIAANLDAMRAERDEARLENEEFRANAVGLSDKELWLRLQKAENELLDEAERIQALEAENTYLKAKLGMAREGLTGLMHAYVSMIETVRDILVSFDRDFDPVDVMERNDPALIAARTTLAAIGETGK